MRERQTPVALVVDEYGGVTGMVRAKKIHEELVGELSAEFEQSGRKITSSGKNSWLVAGILPLDELAEETGVDFSDVASNTVNGLFCEFLGRIPETGDRLEFDCLEMTVLETRKHRLLKASVVRRGGEVDGE
jgi:putative hemolysin